MGIRRFGTTRSQRRIENLSRTSACLAQGCPDPYIACEAAYAAAYLGETAKGIERLNNPAKEADRKIGYSLLECLSLDKAMQPAIRVHLADLKDKAETLPRKANEDAGLMARGILVNLGEMDIKNLHGPESYKAGLKLNHGRRPMVPLPN